MSRKMSAALFWSRVPGGPGCWPYPGAAITGGYRRVKWAGGRKLVHRLSWELVHGSIPDGMCVLHRCDNPPCVNPEHLWLGTYADNNADMKAKGRAANRLTHHPEEREPKHMHCNRGHEVSGTNVTADGWCRTCRRASDREWHRARRIVVRMMADDLDLHGGAK